METKEEFVKFFSDIPEEKWSRGNVTTNDRGERCALGHLFGAFPSCLELRNQFVSLG